MLPYREIGPKEALEAINSGTLLVDVRTEEEYQQVKVKKSSSIPIHTFLSRIDELPKESDIVFMCRSGVRSGLACEYALSCGYDKNKIYNLVGGIEAWIDEGLEYES